MTFCLFSWTCCFEIHSVTIRSGSCRTYCWTWWYFVFYLNHWGPQQPVKNQDTSSLFEREGWLDQCAVKNDISTTVSFSSLSPPSCHVFLFVWRCDVLSWVQTDWQLKTSRPLFLCLLLFHFIASSISIPFFPPSLLHMLSMPLRFLSISASFISDSSVSLHLSHSLFTFFRATRSLSVSFTPITSPLSSDQ